jgi:hypothetical protein
MSWARQVPKGGGEGDLGGDADGRAGAAGDLAAGDEMAEAALGGVVVGWDVGLADEREELAEVMSDSGGEDVPGGGPVGEEGAGEGEQAGIEAALRRHCRGRATDRQHRRHRDPVLPLQPLPGRHPAQSGVRRHRLIENWVYWVLDVVFQEHASRNRTDDAPTPS